jgi:hypothetical protein
MKLVERSTIHVEMHSSPIADSCSVLMSFMIVTRATNAAIANVALSNLNDNHRFVKIVADAIISTHYG